jgi:hypothetical protein
VDRVSPLAPSHLISKKNSLFLSCGITRKQQAQAPALDPLPEIFRVGIGSYKPWLKLPLLTREYPHQIGNPIQEESDHLRHAALGFVEL